MKDYIELTKPRITWLILMSTAVGYFFGARNAWNFWSILHTLLGTALIASGTAALNQWYEREADRKMRRTADRPIPSGRLSAKRALLFGILMSALGFFELALGVNWLSGLLGLFTLLSYLFLYTPLKQRTPLSTLVGAFPGAMPPMIGYAAASGVLDTQAWTLFAILFLWQFPHFLAIAWMYREDYARAGYVVLPAGKSKDRFVAWQTLLPSLALFVVPLVPAIRGESGIVYFAGALVLGGVFLCYSARFVFQMSTVSARRLLFASILYLPLLLVFLALDKK